MIQMTRLLLYDTKSREVREVRASDGQAVRFYCCGPTVYGPAHIGNFRTFVLQDVLRRVIEATGLAMLHVRNLTDVDDKTIRESRARGESLGEFTARWTRKFREDCEKLGMLPPHIEESAVATIPLQIELVSKLVERGNAYVSSDGSVYFKVSSFARYGELSRLCEREVMEGAGGRQDGDEYDRESASDFALWKARRPEDGENFWPSPWGEGRPGWHTECAAMSLHHLGVGFDLHGGGMDLIFPHHENEIAQGCCATGGEFARHWFHVAHLMVDGTKMSKSLGNLHTLEDVEAQGFLPADLRFLLASGHYRQPLNFTWDSLTAAKKAVRRIARLAAKLDQMPVGEDEPMTLEASPFGGVFGALCNDLNTPDALGRLFTAMKPLEALPVTAVIQPGLAKAFRQAISLFGLESKLIAQLGEEPRGMQAPDDVQALADERWRAKAARDWARADELRARLASAGWLVKDTKDGYSLEPVGG